MRDFKLRILLITSIFLLGVAVLIPQPVAAQFNPGANLCQGSGSTNCSHATANAAVGNLLTTVINTLLFAAGTASVIFIIYGAIQYVSSQGDSASINKAKNTILYAVAGLVISFSAFAIVNFVLGVINKAK